MKLHKQFLTSLILFVIFFNVKLYSQDLSKINNLILLNVGNEKITYEQLERAYQKNINKTKPHLYMLEKDSLMDFLNLYANFRLKVLEAKRKGLDKDSSIRAESEQNRKILSENYLYTKKLIEPNVELMAERRKWEYKFSIIFVTYPQAPRKDTTRAWETINKAMEELKKGEDFEVVANKYNDDPQLSQKGGRIDQWITSGRIYRELEDAIYKTEPGQIYPEIISTPFGYFIVKVTDKQPRRWVLGGHILFKHGIDPVDSSNIAERAFVALERIKKGEKFEDIARMESSDSYTANNGGKFDRYYSLSTGFERNKDKANQYDGGSDLLDTKFAEEMFKLKKNQISDVVTTDFGNHIIKCYDEKPVNIADERDEVQRIYRRQYLEEDKRKLFDKLFSELNLKIYEDILNQVVASVDTNKSNINKNWAENISSDLEKKVLFTINKKDYTVAQFIEEMNTNNQLRGYATNRDGLKSAIHKICEPIAIDYATRNLENEYPEFKIMLNEFNDGILLFKAESMEVWEKLKFDSTRARKYYDTTKQRYFTDPMYDITEIYVLSDSLAQEIYKAAINGENFDTLAAKFTQRSGYREKAGHMGLVSGKTNKYGKLVYDKNITDPIVVPPIQVDNGFSIIKVNKYEPPRPKTFEEAIPDFASKLQEQVQKELLNKWLSSLRKTFPVKFEQKNIDQVLKFGKK